MIGEVRWSVFGNALYLAAFTAVFNPLAMRAMRKRLTK